MTMHRAKLILIGLAVLLVAVVCFQNREPVDTKVFFATISMPRILLLVATFAVGFLTGIFAVGLLRSGKSGKNAS